MAQVQFKGVRKSFGSVPVIHGFDMDVRDGEFVVIVGPSGCGKSTLLRMVAGLERITEGEINAYLMDLLKKSAGGSGDESVTLARINIALKTDVVVVVLEAKLGPVPLTYEISGVPERSDGQFTFAVSKVRLGHLPMPGPAGGWLAARAKVVFSKMDEEKRLLGQVSQLKVGRGEVAVATAGTP